MRLPSFPLLAATVACSLLQAAPSAAQPAPPATNPATHDESRQYYKAGNEAFLAGDKRGARAHYLRALELEPQWDILCNLGRAEGELGLDAEALTHLDECLKEYPPSRDPKVQKARGKFYDLRTEIRDRCEQMKCAYTEPPVSSGLATEPQPTAAATEPVTSGASATEPKTAAGASETKPVLDPKEHPSYIEKKSAKWPVVITTGALGVVGLSLGVGFAVLAEDKNREAQKLGSDLVENGVGCEHSQQPQCTEFDKAVQSFQNAQVASMVSLIAGSSFAAAGVVMAIVWPTHSSQKNAKILRPVVAADGKSTFVGVHGKF